VSRTAIRTRKESFMKVSRLALLIVAGGLLLLPMPAKADDDCPASVRAAVEKSFPGSVVKKCEKGSEDGKMVYEIKLKTSDGHRVKMNFDPAGAVLLTQQYLTVDAVPVVVMKSFEGKHQGYKVVRTEKWIYPDGKTTYRVYYAKDNTRKAAIYTNEGVLVQEIEVPATDKDDVDTD
jgi:hypothetical protein